MNHSQNNKKFNKHSTPTATYPSKGFYWAFDTDADEHTIVKIDGTVVTLFQNPNVFDWMEDMFHDRFYILKKCEL